MKLAHAAVIAALLLQACTNGSPADTNDTSAAASEMSDADKSAADESEANESAPAKSAATSTVSGNVLLAGDTSAVTFPLSGVVRVVDVTYADGPSTTIATQTISVTGPGPIPFSIPVSNIDAKASYSVQVHLDADADGAVSEGDYLTVESFPVLTFGYGSVIDVTARRL